MKRWSVGLVALVSLAAACTSGSVTTTPPPETQPPSTTVPPATVDGNLPADNDDLPVDDDDPPVGSVQPPAAPVDVVFINASVITMDPSRPFADGVAVVGEEISHVGTTEEVLEMVGAATRVFDLAGRALLPGFVDPHNHIFLGVDTPDAVEEAQQYLLTSGVTTIGDTAVGPSTVETLRAAEERGDLRIRASLYPVYNSKCDGVFLEDWFLRFPPDQNQTSMVRIPGIKLFADAAGNIGEPCGWAAMSVELPPEFIETVGGDPFGGVVLTAEQMAGVVIKNQERGYQVLVHARGDVTAENALTAFEMALGGEPNTYRHRLEHNDFIRPDQLSRYGEIGVIPTVRGRPSACIINDNGGVHRFGEAVQPWFFQIRSLIDANPGLPVAWHSDIVFERSRRPAVHDLLDLVTRRAIRSSDGTVCEPPDWFAAEAVSVEEALRLMTINGAYALFMDEKVGSIETGKFADLIVLSDDPLSVDPNTLADLEVQLTMVGGGVEVCLPGDLCDEVAGGGDPGDGVAAVLPADPRGCEDLTCYDLAVTCGGLAARDVTIVARHRAPADGTIIYVGGGNITDPYGDTFDMHALGYDTYAIVYEGDLGYYTGGTDAGFPDLSCGTTEVIKWIVENLAERPDAVAAHGISAGANHLGYGLAIHGLGDLVDLVVFASGPIHADLEQACFTYSTAARGRSIDRGYGWEGSEDYCASGSGPDSVRELLRSDSIVTADPGQVRTYSYSRAAVAFILGEEDEGPLNVSRLFFDAITTEKTWMVLAGVGHSLPLDPSGADAVRSALVDGLAPT